MQTENSDSRQYPTLFSWEDLTEIISSGCVIITLIYDYLNVHSDLGKLRRHPDHQEAYDQWRSKIIAAHGSIPQYLLKERLGWVMSDQTPPPTPPPQVANQPKYFTRDIPDKLHKLLNNDWGYAVPHNVEHWVCLRRPIGSRIPLIHQDLYTSDVGYQNALSNGLYGFTNSDNLDGAQEIQNWIIKKFGKDTTAAYFLNPPHLQSVKEVQHFHIFVKR
ncbi:hypothetical protein E3Q23_02122 [Wallemia mellicola]|uniref:Uncharacterized protein n=1 Tax=Wallemia mellicola TaxID=1708541 RepID=A0A4V4MU28_9BASI|nr:hypothetical protein E3Q23_02122 [Wallemia mellicola]TIC15580.1 hypothetical protein E3Q15_01417 [Wallemia mellicola]TIC25004.1 hypothetical protein E3Q12_01202 [Wallemia mellicola]TIC28363.1 hypothetical protein E3Q11_01853 [Wallemia mellicola]TIC45179.1 hypothetical protein E3Q08_01419 [Wallemia mellicola]